MQSLAINKSDYLLQKPTNLPKYHTLNTLNELLIDDSNNDHVDRCKQPELENNSIAAFRTMQSNLTTVGQSAKLPGHTTAKLPGKYLKLKSIEQSGKIGPDDNAFHISTALTLHSDICKAFDKELHNKRT